MRNLNWVPVILILIPLVVACSENDGFIPPAEGVSGLTSTPSPSHTPIAQAEAVSTQVHTPTPEQVRTATPLRPIDTAELPTPTSASTNTSKPELPLPNLEALEGVTTIQLVVQQSYPQLEEDFSLPIADICQRTLERVGFEVVDETATQYDATLFVTVTGQALSASYLPGGTMYTGAELEGNLSLSVPRAEPYERPLSAQVSPPASVSYSAGAKPTEPRQAPFGEVEWQQPFFLALHELWGLQPVIRALEDENPQVRMAAASALGEIGPETGVVSALIRALGDNDTRAGERAAAVLAQISGPILVPDFIESLRDLDGDVRANAAYALGVIGPEAKEAVPYLIEALEDEDDDVRKNVVVALEKIGPEPGVIPTLIRAMEDESAFVRVTATQALGRIGPEAVPALIEALQDEDSTTRKNAANALWYVYANHEIGPETREVVLALIQALQDEDRFVREMAAYALGGIGPEASEAVPALITALMDDEGQVTYFSSHALKYITGEDFGEDQERWQQWWESQK
jgi:HEAT repeat protein